jgi:hypothetical protein
VRLFPTSFAGCWQSQALYSPFVWHLGSPSPVIAAFPGDHYVHQRSGRFPSCAERNIFEGSSG